MNFLKKGPELKLPDVKVPDFLLDVYYDLKERHLLPLVAILLVAIVALPIALSGGSDSEAEEEAGGAIATPSGAIPSSKLIVAKAAPGLRDYRKRLADRTAKDPFKQQYAGAAGETGEGGTSGSEGSAPEESTPGGTEPTGTTPSEGDGEPPDEGNLRFYSFAIDVRVVPVPTGAGASKAKPTVRHNLPELTMLPSRKVPALTFMSVSKDRKKALFLVSDKVSGLFGDASCVVGSEACQLLALEPGLPETIVYGGNDRTYRIELLKLRLLSTDKLNKAALGNPKHD